MGLGWSSREQGEVGMNVVQRQGKGLQVQAMQSMNLTFLIELYLITNIEVI